MTALLTVLSLTMTSEIIENDNALQDMQQNLQGRLYAALTEKWGDMGRMPYWYLFTHKYLMAPLGSEQGLPPPSHVNTHHVALMKEREIFKNMMYDRMLERDKALVCETFAARSLLYFGIDHPVRARCIRLVRSRLWAGLVPFIIFGNIILLAASNPLEGVALKDEASSGYSQTVVVMETAFHAFFMFECLAMILAHGLCWPATAYLRNAANIVDFTIVVTSVLETVSTFAPDSHTGTNFAALSSLRAVKPLRVMTRSAQLREVVVIVLRAAPAIITGLAVVTLLLQFVGSLLGMQLFMGLLRNRCYSQTTGEILSQQICMNADMTVLSSEEMGKPYSCPSGYKCLPLCSNPGKGFVSFDDVGDSTITLLQVLTMSGWSDMIQHYQDALSPAAALFFVALVIVGPIQMMGFFVAVNVTKILEFRSQQWHLRENSMMARWRLANVCSVVQDWCDNAHLVCLGRRRPKIALIFMKTRRTRLVDCFVKWKTELQLRSKL